ncbi:aspartyl-phosphate phosphatase Spo0E family protein [Lederbergia panacisoli]|uniref:aspartyl-phosphate phosphatase Spo0E family protein n=1 Tax=Lederbergia panacisoli TaxID=1255251 RepID=UPI00214C6F1C|nr:aspartyl-phosphate phosphatase Spo0E family protein [Lederbergia panacisoli]MCR2822697.1 aspartyl-phosphate phosphatase Spo0E family protein [Lederbergia panacisoli]
MQKKRIRAAAYELQLIAVSSEISAFVSGENIDVNTYFIMDNTEKILETKIIKVRQEMVNAGLSKGLNNPETLNLSQKLDSLLNQYSQLK